MGMTGYDIEFHRNVGRIAEALESIAASLQEIETSQETIAKATEEQNDVAEVLRKIAEDRLGEDD